ncbi:MAG: hypothetical protein PHO86_04935 [Bacilli bacterium]|nr:hypothetical protein [Bacilli bacterium]
MKGLIKCHFSYLISKTTMIILFLVLIIVTINCYFTAISAIDMDYENQVVIYYYQNSFFFIKTLNAFVSVFLFSYSFTGKQDNYCFLIITGKISRLRYLISKIITIASCLFLFLWFQAFIYVMIGFLIIPSFMIDILSFLPFGNLYLIIIYYGCFSLSLVQLTDNIYIAIIPISLYTVSTMLIESNEKIAYLRLILPNFSADSFYLDKSYWHILFLLVIIILINVFINENRDF